MQTLHSTNNLGPMSTVCEWRTKLPVESLDLCAIPLSLCILQRIALKHEVCGRRLNVEPVGQPSQQSNPCKSPTTAQ